MLKLPKLDTWNTLLLVLCLIIILILAPALSKHVKPNGPIIGGDVYQAFGAATFINQGHAPWQDAVYAGESNWYPWLFHVLAVILSRVTFMSLSTTFVWIPLIVTLLVALTYFKLGKELFNPEIGFLVAFLTVFMTGVGSNSQVSVPVNFSYVLAGWYFIFLHRANKEHTIRSYLGAGALLGLVGLTHIHTFFACMVVLFAYLLSAILFKNAGTKT